LRGNQPLSDAEAAPFGKLLGVAAEKVRLEALARRAGIGAAIRCNGSEAGEGGYRATAGTATTKSSGRRLAGLVARRCAAN